MLERLASNLRTVFLQSDLAKMFPAEFQEARRAGLVRPQSPNGSQEGGVFFAGRHLTVIEDGGDLVGFDDSDTEFEPVRLRPADLQTWALNLDSLSQEMQRLNGWAGRPGPLTSRLYSLGERKSTGRHLVFILGLYRHDDVAERVLRQLVKEPLAADVAVVLSAGYEPPPSLREEVRTHAVITMRLPPGLTVPDPLFKRTSASVLPDLTNAEEREFIEQGYLCRVGVHLPGRKRKQRMIVEVDGAEVELTLVPYRLFLRLSLALHTKPGGWVDRGTMKQGGGLASESFYNPEGAEPALGRLRDPFSTALGSTLNKATEFLEVRGGRLRISTHPKYVTWDRRQLLTQPDEGVLKLAQSLPVSQFESEV